MTTHLNLHHMGEVVLRGLLEAIAAQGKLGAVACKLHLNCTLDSLLVSAGVKPPWKFDANVRLKDVTIPPKTTYAFDGAHGVDVVCHAGSLGLGIEAKLGIDRLSSNEFASRFLKPLSTSRHKKPRVKGGMTAILNHRALKTNPLNLNTVCPNLNLVASWAVVVRKQIWTNWTKGNKSGPKLLNGHVLLLEDIARIHGDASDFDKIVAAQVGAGFASAWGVFP